MNQKLVVTKRNFDSTADKVWQALTDNSKIKKMVFDIESFKAEEGFEFKLEAGFNKINSCTYGR